MTIKSKPNKIYGIQQKQFLEYVPFSKHKKNFKQPNLPPKRIRKRANKA